MTEQQWLSCTDPLTMLNFLCGTVSERKLRLFACACCRRIWHLFTDESSRCAIEAAEQFTDGRANPDEMTRTRRETWDLLRCEEERPSSWVSAVRAAGRVGEPEAARTAYASGEASNAIAEEAEEIAAERPGVIASESEAWYFGVQRLEKAWQCSLLRDLVGNTFHQVVLAPTLLSWQDATLVRLAQAVYDERHLPAGNLDNARLAVLADALEEAGCTDADILNHCRQPGDHVRGCWVVDLLLNKS
jgi:hypothetical protein